MSYATVEDYMSWSGTNPAPRGTERALDRATNRIQAYLPRDPLLDPRTGDPLEGDRLTAVTDALKKATCAHAEYLILNATAASLGAYSSISLGPLQLSQKVGEPDYLVQEAVDYLKNAGLTYRGVVATTGYHRTYSGKMGARGIITDTWDTWVGGEPGP